MPGKIPRRPSGSSAEAAFQKAVHENIVNESKIGFVDGMEMGSTTLGKYVVASGGTKGGGTRIQMFKLQSVEDDYLVCHDWDGTTEGTDDVYIAKHPEIRCSTASETVYGVERTFTYEVDPADPDGLNVIRTAVEGAETEEQRVVPPWKLDEVIYAIECDTGVTATVGEEEEETEEEVTWLMQHTRHWAEIATE